MEATAAEGADAAATEEGATVDLEGTAEPVEGDAATDAGN